MTKPDEIVNIIGRAVLRSALGVSDTSISNAIADGKFPANWRDVVDELSEPVGINVRDPKYRACFNMRRRAA